MKIDYIYGNPPYEGQLHLDILSFVKDFADEIVWLHPARWAQSLTSPKELRHFNGRIKEFDLIRENTKILFCGMDISGDLIITTLIRSGGKSMSDFNPLALRSVFPNPDVMMNIYNKVMKKTEHFVKEQLVTDKLTDYAVVFSLIGGNGGQGNSKVSKFVTSNQDCVYSNGVAEDGRTFNERRSKGSPTKDVIDQVRFASYKEAKNFLESLKTPFYIAVNSITKCDMHVHPDQIPLMPDYNEPWTNERLCDFYGLDKTERDEIDSVVSNPDNY